VRSATPIPPSVRHALFFCLQKQNEVANPDLLFHSQGEEFLPATIRAMIPNFLGAVDPQQALLENRLHLLRQELAQLEAVVAAARSLSPASGQALALVTEAVEAGLLQPSREGMTAERALEHLRQAIAESAPTQMPDAGDDPVSALVEQRRGLRERHGRARARIANLKRAAQENNEFLDQAVEQHARLATLNLFAPANTADQEPRCPVCDSHQPLLSQIAEVINRDLGRLDADMTVIGNDTPEINALIAAEEDSLQEIRGALGRNQEHLDTLTAGQRAAQGQVDASRRAVLVTRVAKNAGLRVIRLHDARHGTATLLTAADVAPRVVMEILGHSQIAMTMNVYTHVVQDTQREAVSHMDRMLRRRPGHE
jgi:hypothetical protein